MLKALLMSAQFGTGVTKASELDPVEAFDFAMERIGGSLGALAVIADRAAIRLPVRYVAAERTWITPAADCFLSWGSPSSACLDEKSAPGQIAKLGYPQDQHSSGTAVCFSWWLYVFANR